jgi:hypothetical protein
LNHKRETQDTAINPTRINAGFFSRRPSPCGLFRRWTILLQIITFWFPSFPLPCRWQSHPDQILGYAHLLWKQPQCLFAIPCFRSCSSHDVEHPSHVNHFPCYPAVHNKIGTGDKTGLRRDEISRKGSGINQTTIMAARIFSQRKYSACHRYTTVHEWSGLGCFFAVHAPCSEMDA